MPLRGHNYPRLRSDHTRGKNFVKLRVRQHPHGICRESRAGLFPLCRSDGVQLADLVGYINPKNASTDVSVLSIFLKPTYPRELTHSSGSGLLETMDGNYSDHVASDDLDAILEMSRVEYEMNSSAGPSQSRSKAEPPNLRKQALNEEISALDAEINGYDEEILQIEAMRALRVENRENLLKELQQLHAAPVINGKGKGRAVQEGIDYTADGFDWSHGLKVRMQRVFGINGFRLCQEGVCNANMDGRDIVCVMPTGGGKSLTYQLPALFTPGCTLVISPLIALITDQILHLREAGIKAVMLTGGTSMEESKKTSKILTSMAGRDGPPPDEEIKLCYVTPEKIARSQYFIGILEKLAVGGKLARIIIDEAHCVSQLGHDFRPDYQKLHVLRQRFPRVPIMALSATCPPRVLQDLIKTLGLKGVVDGKNAKADGTVYFSAPLYRKNLHYMVLPKPSSAAAAIQIMTDYILQHHKDDSGIVYCLTKKDAESVAAGLNATSSGTIKTGVYHAEVRDLEKERLHKQWRKGAIQVVCATIAFGLGIDKGDVRFVLHHSMSKSLDGFYQESGRAGRDGKEADCVLYYRPQDGVRLSSIMCSEKDWRPKLHSMLRFAQDMQECRKVHFAKYFSASSQLSMSSWTTEDSDALARCGHCDNCTRPSESVDQKDVTVEAWQILKIAEAVRRTGGCLTLSKLADLARGAGGGAYELSGGVRRGSGIREKMNIDVVAMTGGKVGLSKDETEYLLVHLLVFNFLEESFSSTAYQTNVYLVPGPQAVRLARLPQEGLQNQDTIRIRIVLPFRNRKGRASGNGEGGSSRVAPEKPIGHVARRSLGGRSEKRKRVPSSSEDEVNGDDEDDSFISPEDDAFAEDRAPRQTRHIQAIEGSDEEDEDDDEDEGWAHSMRERPLPKKRRGNKNRVNGRASQGARTVMEGDNEVLVLSSD